MGGVSGDPVQAGAPRRPWPVAGLLVEFVLDIADIARDGGPVLDTLIFVVAVEANVAPVTQNPDLELAYGALRAPPPDEIRRPVSISAIAASLGLPYETVRRHVRRMAAQGACEVGPRGVVVPAARLSSPAYARIAVDRYERTRRLYHDLQALGVLEPPPPGDPSAPAGREPPVRLCNRLLSEYYLRAADLLMRRVGDPVSWLILLGVVRENLAALSPEARTAPHLDPEAMGRPVRRAALAAALGIPAETVRRRLIDLQRRGFCRTGPDGVSIPPGAAQRPEVQELLQENEANLHRFVARLRRYGVLDRWDAEAAAAAA